MDLLFKAGNQIFYFLRKPEYPLICAIQGQVFAAKSEKMLVKKLASFELEEGGDYVMSDATGEHWALRVDPLVLTPFTFKKRWTKLALVRLVNARSNKVDPNEKPYSERSLNSKRFEVVFRELIDRIV